MSSINRRILAAAALALAVPAPAAMAARAVPVLETAIGMVSVRPRAGAPYTRATAGMRLPDGMMVHTGANARAMIRYNATDLVRLAANTDLTVGSLAAARGGMEASLLQLWVGRARCMLRRARRSAQPDFIAVAGSVVAAVKGTDFELNKPDAGSADNVSLRVDAGSVLTGVTRADGQAEFVRTLDAVLTGRGAREIGRGFQVTVSRGAPVPEPSRAAPRTGLDVVSATGKVFVVTAQGKTEVHPGDAIPAGSKVEVEDGKAVFANGDAAAEAKDGAVFTYAAERRDDEVVMTIAVAADSDGAVVLDSGGGSVTLDAGERGTGGGGEVAQETAPAGESKPVVTAPPGAEPEAQAEPEPEALVAPPTETAASDLPPPPPDTLNQDFSTVSPSAPI